MVAYVAKYMGFTLVNVTKDVRVAQAGDCAVIALMSALSIPYEDAYRLLYEEGLRQRRIMNSGLVIEAVLEEHGFTKIHERTNRRTSVGEFMSTHRDGYFVIMTAKHIFTYIAGTWYDSGFYGADTYLPVREFEVFEL